MRDFDKEYEEDFNKKKGIEFVLGGHTFTTKQIIPPAALLHQETGLTAAVTFLTQVLKVQDRKVFTKMVENPDVLISAEQIDQIAAWVIEELSGRPTVSPGSSGGGDGGTSSGSRVVSLSQEKTGSE